MRIPVGAALLVSTIFVPALRGDPAKVDSQREELKALDARFDQALLTGDRAFVESLIDDRLVNVDSGAGLAGKAEAMREAQARPAEMKFALTEDDVKVELFGDVGIVSSLKTVAWEDQGGRAKHQQFRETNTYLRTASGWRLIASQEVEPWKPQPARDVALDLDVDPSAILGNARADIVFISYSDYQCPFSRQFAAETLPAIEHEYVDSGRVGLVLRDLPLPVHPLAAGAAAAARCAARRGRLREMNRRLFSDPQALEPESLVAAALDLGLDVTEFRACLDDPETAAEVRAGSEEASRLGIQGTPVFLVGVRSPDGRRVKAVRLISGALPREIFKGALDSTLATRTP